MLLNVRYVKYEWKVTFGKIIKKYLKKKKVPDEVGYAKVSQILIISTIN